jgi:hypothetical protein
MIERVAQVIYECDRCMTRQSIPENEQIQADHPLYRWMVVRISPVPARGKWGARDAHLCDACVRDLRHFGPPFAEEDEAPPPAKSTNSPSSSATTRSPHAELLDILEAPPPRPTASST